MAPRVAPAYHDLVSGGILIAPFLAGCGAHFVEEDFGGLRHLVTTVESNNGGTAKVTSSCASACSPSELLCSTSPIKLRL